MLSFGTHIIKEQSSWIEEWIEHCSDQTTPDSMNVVKKQIEDTQWRSAAPDCADIDDGEDDRPEEREWDGENGCYKAIHPETSHVEDEESQTPDEFKAMSWIWFSNDILKLNIDMIIDFLLISIQYIQANSEVLSAFRSI